MIITVGNTKGGVGKTTIALNLAIARALAGKDVWVVDGDRQGTAQTALTIRAESGRTPMVVCSVYSDGATLRSQVQQQKDMCDDIVIDAGGRDSTALRAALALGCNRFSRHGLKRIAPPRTVSDSRGPVLNVGV